ncbi:MAG: BON domain-containing protein [Vicinamibacterales bacterium]|nr:BON domain-containing protein [Vicinamibacterales bacterium]
MSPRVAAATIIVALTLGLLPVQAQHTRDVLAEVLGGLYRLDQFTAFDWIDGTYDRGTVTLEGYAVRLGLRERAEALARKTAGVDEVTNNIVALPTHRSDDDLRIRAYIAVYGHSALAMYAPGGGLSSSMSLRELQTARTFGVDSSTQFQGPHALHLVVSGGRIQMLGTVNAAQDRQIAEVQVRNLSGVLGVVNRVQVRGR